MEKERYGTKPTVFNIEKTMKFSNRNYFLNCLNVKKVNFRVVERYYEAISNEISNSDF